MRAELESLLARIRDTENCTVKPPTGSLPSVVEPHRLPDDLRHFYELCGGCLLHTRGVVSCEIVEPSRVVLENPVIVGAAFEYGDDISNSWYVIVARGTSEHVTIDLSAKRLGRCYESFWDTHAMAGSCPIVATSFVELLRGLYSARGEAWYWLQRGHRVIGDAYDDVVAKP